MRGPRPSRSTFIACLLAATLALTALLANEARQAARSHRATAENVLRDYARFAAWELQRVGRTQLFDAIQHESQKVHQLAARGQLERAVRAATPPCPSGCGRPAVHTAFKGSLPDGQFTFAGAPEPASVRAVLDEAVAAANRSPDDFTCPTLRVASLDDGGTAVVVWRPVYNGSQQPVGMTGFVSDAGLVTQVFEKLLKGTPLLPPSLVREGPPNAALAIRVLSPDGRQLFARDDGWSQYSTEERLAPIVGSLRLAVAITPDAAAGLVIGGLPRERLPFVIGLLALTAGLVVVALVQMRREAELSRLRADFVSGVSHELRTPLAQIRMFTETLLLGRVRSEAEGRRSLEVIARETRRLSQLVENVLLYARGERRQPRIAPEPTPLAPLVRDVVDGFRELAAARQAKLRLDADEAIAARVDPGAVRQVLLNLLDNAVKYGPAGQTVRVSLAMHEGRARLMVQDEGPGVAPQDAARIWQPFNRLAHTAAVTGGTGIGLAIVRQLVDLHGGRAWVEPGAGARFVVELPNAWAEPAGAAVA